VVSAAEKAVSSSAGHALMDVLPYASARFEVARNNLQHLIECMRHDDRLEEFMSICESEALQLHALMMSGRSPYILMEPNTLSIIREVWRFRKETHIPVCFTLDAGPNVHLLYPLLFREQVVSFLKSLLNKYCQDIPIINDHISDRFLK
jgi:diphosphomevalonate decarboxylase